METNETTVTRRTALLGGTGALALLGVRAMPGRAQAARAIQSGGGVAGGGTLAAGDTTATFSVFASRFVVEGEDDPLLAGSVNWLDGTGFGFTSADIAVYGLVEGDRERARQIEGTAKIASPASEDAAEQPFRMYIVEGGGLGDGAEADYVELTVGPADNTIYSAKGSLASGDIMLVRFDFGGGAEPDASPEPA